MALFLQGHNFYAESWCPILSLIQDAAKSYKHLLKYIWRFRINLKNISEINIIFYRGNFLHLSGIAKLSDLNPLKDNNAYKIYLHSLNGKFTDTWLQSSIFYTPYNISSRLECIRDLPDYLSTVTSIYTFNPELFFRAYGVRSLIIADYVFKFSASYIPNNTKIKTDEIYFHLVKNGNSMKPTEFNPVSSFGMGTGGFDYSRN